MYHILPVLFNESEQARVLIDLLDSNDERGSKLSILTSRHKNSRLGQLLTSKASDIMF